MDYKKLGFKAGIEIHQQLSGKKLFCDCLAIVNDSNEPDILFERKLRASAGEMGKVDKAAAYEMAKQRTFKYEAKSSSSCLVEYDEEPPHAVNSDHLMTALEVSLLLNADIVDEVHFMRKTVVDGSNTSAFQRTALIAVDGYIETTKGKVKIDSICLEEEAAKKLEEKPHIVRYSLDRLGVALLEIATDASIKDAEHAKEVSAKLGMILRSTGKVRRGIGSIRQDVNVSIKTHPRVEIKGFQEIRHMPKVIDNEVKRQMKKKGEPHVRKANTDGSSTFLRPMPGAARMYPETDVPSIRITKDMLKSITLPELIDERILKLEKEFNLSSDLAREIDKQQIDLSLYKYKKVKPQLIAQILIEYPKEIKKRFNLDAGLIRDQQYKEVFSYLDQGKISKDAVLEILIGYIKGKKVNLDKFKTLDDKELEKILKEVVKKNKGAPIGALMGAAMKELRGKVEGKKVMGLLKKLL